MWINKIIDKSTQSTCGEFLIKREFDIEIDSNWITRKKIPAWGIYMNGLLIGVNRTLSGAKKVVENKYELPNTHKKIRIDRRKQVNLKLSKEEKESFDTLCEEEGKNPADVIRIAMNDTWGLDLELSNKGTVKK